MAFLIWGLGLSALAFLIHLSVWRIKIPQRQTRAINIIFSLTLTMGLVLGKALSLDSLWETLHVGFFFVSMWTAYAITYSAFEAQSPTLVMVEQILSAGPLGLDETSFSQQMSDALLVVPRIDDLVRDNMATIYDGQYCLTAKGKIMGLVFIYYRRLIKAPMGG